TAYLLRHLLNSLGAPTGLISTVEYNSNSGARVSTQTTPEPATLFALFDQMRRNHLRCCAMELSSHALDQERIGNIAFRAAIFTNLTGDHLDYHKTTEAYFAAKSKLFLEHLAPDGCAVINGDDYYGQKLAAQLRQRGKQPLVFGEHNCEIALAIESISLSGSAFRLGDAEFHIPLVGKHNIYNSAGAILAAAAGRNLKLNAPELIAAAATVPAAPGRLEKFVRPDGAVFFVDYAHTDDALKNVLELLRQVATKRVLVLFGCGGDRDKSKRPRMGRVVESLADVAIATSDNPRSENPLSILDEILSGVEHREKILVEPDRRKAIALAWGEARPGDLVLLAGKGHEDYQEIAGVKHHFDDREELRKLF
ncbi:MAG: UDP-N-acetylmuramoyl-L-alanyl-D-glutamate--2,6-diaminopimelate ligase, partial [Victivallaceae bacterium]|nr:UDP-N-acetylmuramoyl-L-alanyl-D-glutamate--2,6-diaminopimelate ligase [Victivallaceae bacterium]